MKALEVCFVAFFGVASLSLVSCNDEDEALSGTCPVGSECGEALANTHGDTAQCERWAKRCECQLNPGFMKTSCVHSCNLHEKRCEADTPECEQQLKVTPLQTSGCHKQLWDACPKTCVDYVKTLQIKAKECSRVHVPGGLQDMPIDKMFSRIADEGWAAQFQPKVLSRDPWIMLFDNFLSAEQVAGVLKAAEDSGHEFQPSRELSAGKSDRRTSESMFCRSKKCQNDERILVVYEAVQNITGLPLPAQELIQLLKYSTGQKYVAHMDTSDTYALAANGHRIYTMFLYLSDLPDNAGGGTHFPKLNLTVQPKMGRAVLWTNVLPENPRKEDSRLEHEGLPVLDAKNPDGTEAVKFGANLWLYGYDWRHQWKVGCMNVDIGL